MSFKTAKRSIRIGGVPNLKIMCKKCLKQMSRRKVSEIVSKGLKRNICRSAICIYPFWMSTLISKGTKVKI